MIDYVLMKDSLVEFIQQCFSGGRGSAGCNAVIGISGGKDSTVAAALCAEALGQDRVIGVMMPCGYQSDIDDSKQVVDSLGIRGYTIDIGPMYTSLRRSMQDSNMSISEQTDINIKPRLRMTTLYAVSQSFNGRVINNTNLSEYFVGYGTKYGDLAGDFSLFRYLRKTDVVEVGKLCDKVPTHLIVKPPSDGLTGMTDEEKFGFTYEQLDNYLLTGWCEDPQVKERIDSMHIRAVQCKKSLPIQCFESYVPELHLW
jgi:NAD+ synthase